MCIRDSSTAMARLVSIPVALAVESVLNNKITYGVTAAPKSPQIVTSWLDAIKKEAQIFNFIDKLLQETGKIGEYDQKI